MKLNRRTFLAGASAVVGTLAFAPAVLGQAKRRVVVIGGGPGGATAAKYIATGSKGAVEVVLVEPLKEFTTCFHSNLYLGGFRTFDTITHQL
jgi:ribulose 1,5-bisphosphate synthetase/thiazole synthase